MSINKLIMQKVGDQDKTRIMLLAPAGVALTHFDSNIVHSAFQKRPT